MYLNHITEEKVERILKDVLADIRHDEDWYEFFPSVLGYEVFLPKSIEEAITHPDALYGDDHAVALVAISYPALHSIMDEIVKFVIYTNIHWEKRYTNERVEPEGACFARDMIQVCHLSKII